MVVPSVATLCMDAGMTSLAKGNEVLPCVRPTFRQRYLMMHFLNRHILSLKQTKLAEWMCLYIAVTNLLPGPSVSFLMGWIPLVSVVPLVLEPLVLWAILLLGKVGTARISTGFLWFSWHVSPPSFGQQKSPRSYRTLGASFYFLLIILYHIWNLDISGQTRTFPATLYFFFIFYLNLHKPYPRHYLSAFPGIFQT